MLGRAVRLEAIASSPCLRLKPLSPLQSLRATAFGRYEGGSGGNFARRPTENSGLHEVPIPHETTKRQHYIIVVFIVNTKVRPALLVTLQLVAYEPFASKDHI